MLCFAGGDIGKTGALAVIDHLANLLYIKSFDKLGWKLCHRRLEHFKPTLTCIEKVQSRSGQGVKSVFSFGMNYGGWIAQLEGLELPYELIPPTRWQRAFLGTFKPGESKKKSLEFIKRKYPYVKLKDKDHGISDAICLAMYALLQYRRLAGRV